MLEWTELEVPTTVDRGDTISELANKLDDSGSHVPRIVTELAEKDFVCRPDPDTPASPVKERPIQTLGWDCTRSNTVRFCAMRYKSAVEGGISRLWMLLWPPPLRFDSTRSQYCSYNTFVARSPASTRLS